MVEVLGVDPNFRAKDGWTALQSACYKSNLDIIEYLVLKCKADPNETN